MNTSAIRGALIVGFLAANAGAQPPAAGLPPAILQSVSNAPNPFDSRLSGLAGETQILYTLAEDANVRVAVYDLFGVKVREWSFAAGADGGRSGRNDIVWDGTNAAGQKVSKGGYLALLNATSSSGSARTIRKIGVIH